MCIKIFKLKNTKEDIKIKLKYDPYSSLALNVLKLKIEILSISFFIASLRASFLSF